MAVALLGLLLGAVPVIVLPGVLSTFEPVKTLLVDAVAVLACLGVPVLRLIPGVSQPGGGPGLVDRFRSMDRVRQVTIAGVTASALVALLATLSSVAPDTSWFGTLGRGQGTIFMIALGAILVLTTGDLRRHVLRFRSLAPGAGGRVLVSASASSSCAPPPQQAEGLRRMRTYLCGRSPMEDVNKP